MGVAAQLVDGSLGMGYGVTCSSMLVYAGFMPVVVSSSVHMSEIATTLFSGLSHIKFGNVDKRLFFRLTGFGVLGGVLGVLALVKLSIDGAHVKKYMSALLLAMGCIIIIIQIVRRKVVTGEISTSKLGFLGLLAGFMDAAGGGGWGPIMTSTLTVGNVEPRKAVGTTDLAEFFVTVAIVVTFIATMGLDSFRWDIALILAAAAVPVTVIAAYLCRKMPQRILGILIGTLLILVNLRTLLSK